MNELSGRTALVTGATSGIGKAAALALAAQGATVLVHGRDPQRGEQTVKEIEAAGGTARFLAADLREPAGITGLAEAAGEVDVLVNNAGSSWFGPSADLTTEQYDVLFDGNVRSAYLLTAALATTLLGRAAEPAEIGEVIAFLAGPKAGYITGATIPVDGGRTAV